MSPMRTGGPLPYRPYARRGSNVLPVPRQDVYDAYWRFAAERQAIFHRRTRNEAEPWTTDPILVEHKFCNTYRASDRVSQFLIRDVIYGDEISEHDEIDTLLRIVLFRLFSRESTWHALTAATGGVTMRTFDRAYLADVLDSVSRRMSIYTGAFILCANDAYGQPSKHRNHLELVHHMFFRERLGERLMTASNLGEVYRHLLEFPLIGPFMAYQIAIDLNYSPVINFDEDDFTMPGPGALRGIRKVFRDTGTLTLKQIVHQMVDRQEEEFERLGLHFQDLFGRRLHAIDCQGLFCEIDKYSRKAFPELRSARSRIKAKFRASQEPLPLFYPPKWGINGRIPVNVRGYGQQTLLTP